MDAQVGSPHRFLQFLGMSAVGSMGLLHDAWLCDVLRLKQWAALSCILKSTFHSFGFAFAAPCSRTYDEG